MLINEKIFEYIDQERDNMLKFWQELVEIESGSSYKQGLDCARDYLVKSFEAAKARVTLKPYKDAGDLIIADFNADGKEAPIVFSGHYDTVFKEGTILERPFTIKDGIAYGPGVLDMKAGVTMMLFVAKGMIASGYTKRPIRIVLAGDEEVGHAKSNGAEDFAIAVRGACAAFNFETGYTDNGFVTGRKGGARAYYKIYGVGAHAGNEPEKGRNAILELAHKVVEIQGLNDFEAGLTYNCGVFNGGTVPNAVPEEASLVVDIRFKKINQAEDARKALETIANKTFVEGTRTEFKFDLTIPPMENTEGVQKLFTLLEESAQELNFGDIFPKFVGGGSDAAYEVKEGIPTVCATGIAGGKNHSVEEFAVVDTMFTRSKLIAHTALKL